MPKFEDGFKLEAKRLIITGISDDYCKNVAGLYSDTENMYATGVGSDTSMDEIGRKISAVNAEEISFSLVLAEKDSTEFVGFVKGYVKKDYYCWINTFIIAHEKRKSGFGTEAFEKITTYLCNTFNISDVYLSVFSDNKAAVSFWEGLGFTPKKSIHKRVFETNKIHCIDIMTKRLQTF